MCQYDTFEYIFKNIVLSNKSKFHERKYKYYDFVILFKHKN